MSKLKELKNIAMLCDMCKQYAENYHKELKNDPYIWISKNSAGLKRVSLELSIRTATFRKTYEDT